MDGTTQSVVDRASTMFAACMASGRRFDPVVEVTAGGRVDAMVLVDPDVGDDLPSVAGPLLWACDAQAVAAYRQAPGHPVLQVAAVGPSGAWVADRTWSPSGWAGTAVDLFDVPADVGRAGMAGDLVAGLLVAWSARSAGAGRFGGRLSVSQVERVLSARGHRPVRCR